MSLCKLNDSSFKEVVIIEMISKRKLGIFSGTCLKITVLEHNGKTFCVFTRLSMLWIVIIFYDVLVVSPGYARPHLLFCKLGFTFLNSVAYF